LARGPPLAPTRLPTSMPATMAPAEVGQSLVAAAALLGLSLLIAWAAGVFRRRSIDGPVRVALDRSAIPLIVVTLAGGAAWLGVSAVYLMQFMSAHPGVPARPENLSGHDLAMLSILPPAVGLLILLMGDAAAGRLSRAIGYDPARIPGGIVRGIVAALATLPLIYAASILLELFYRAIHFEHPAEHELLGAMKDTTPQVRRLLIIGACAVAPVFEEMFFRGHIQTLLLRFFTPRPRPRAAVEGLASPLAGTSDPMLQPIQAIPLPYEAPAIESESDVDPPRPAVWSRWLAVLITALLFTMVHPAWMRPVIFILALCLGYGYERTGNLWVAILIHAAFNTASTVAFLNMM